MNLLLLKKEPIRILQEKDKFLHVVLIVTNLQEAILQAVLLQGLHTHHLNAHLLLQVEAIVLQGHHPLLPEAVLLQDPRHLHHLQEGLPTAGNAPVIDCYY